MYLYNFLKIIKFCDSDNNLLFAFVSCFYTFKKRKNAELILYIMLFQLIKCVLSSGELKVKYYKDQLCACPLV